MGGTGSLTRALGQQGLQTQEQRCAGGGSGCAGASVAGALPWGWVPGWRDEKSGPGWVSGARALGAPGGLRWAERVGGGVWGPGRLAAQVFLSPLPRVDTGRPPHKAGPPAPSWPRGLADHSSLPCTRLRPAGAPRGCQGLDAGMSETPALAPRPPPASYRLGWNPAPLRAWGTSTVPRLQVCVSRVCMCLFPLPCAPGGMGSSVGRVQPQWPQGWTGSFSGG